MRAPTTPGRILILDDDAEICAAISAILRTAGHTVETYTNASDALARLSTFAPDVLVTDVRLPDRDGFSVMQAAHGFDPLLAVVVMTGFGTIADAVRAMSGGAAHYIAKPVIATELLDVIASAVARRQARRRGRTASAGRREDVPSTLVGASPAMLALLRDLANVAPTPSTVLITGETGTGKERVAHAIHEASPRASKPFVRVHCGSLSESHLESELFGHEPGAVDGAVARQQGRLEVTSGGTLFLDDIGEISPTMQTKLLRVLQERSFERVGGQETLTADVRIIAATSRDLSKMVAEGTFRADLYYRLNVVALEVPPLRARRGDLPLLVEYFLGTLSERLGREPLGITADAMRALERHSWPGNVRELENVLERAAVLARGNRIDAEDLTPHLVQPATTSSEVTIPGATFAEVERHLILSTYESCGRNVTRTAEILGLSLRTVHYRLREYRGQTGRRRSSMTESRTTEPSDGLPTRPSSRRSH